MTVEKAIVRAAPGRQLEALVSGPPGGLTIVLHNGTPAGLMAAPPIAATVAERGMRLVLYARPGYEASTPDPGRRVRDAAADLAAVLDALGAGEFVTVGWSGGGPHALACAAVLRGRVLATVCMSGPAPFDAEGLDWFAGMAPAGAAEYRAAATGRAALEAYLASAQFDPQVFTPADHAAAFGAWSWMGTVAGQALATDHGGMVDDDLAYVTPWGCDPKEITTPILLVHGAQDRLVPSSHATWLAQRCRTAELWLRPDDGHVSILNSSVMALDWLREHASRR